MTAIFVAIILSIGIGVCLMNLFENGNEIQREIGKFGLTLSAIIIPILFIGYYDLWELENAVSYQVLKIILCLYMLFRIVKFGKRTKLLWSKKSN